MLVGFITFIVLILVHEFGHYIAAKRNGVEVEEFGIGFPPKITGRTMGKGFWRTEYTLNWLPLGGFVRLKGENAADKRKGSFGSASLKVKTKIALAGVGMNALVAVLIFSVLAAKGMPQFFDGQFRLDNFITESSQQVAVSSISKDTPAYELGLEDGDIITAINDQPVVDETELVTELQANKGQLTKVSFLADGSAQSQMVKLLDDQDERGVLGVFPVNLQKIKHNPLVAPVVGIGTAVQFSVLTLQGFGNSIADLLTGNFQAASENVTGPVGIFAIFSAFSNLGYAYLLFFAGIISITLAVINVLPLPALDGGRLFMAYLVDGFKLNITEQREDLIHLAGFVALLVLAVVITVVDIGRF
jgi:regulator of sigma E protease